MYILFNNVTRIEFNRKKANDNMIEMIVNDGIERIVLVVDDKAIGHMNEAIAAYMEDMTLDEWRAQWPEPSR